MIFEHKETGLRLKVNRIDKFDTFETTTGIHRVLVEVDLETECGQTVLVDNVRIDLDSTSAAVFTREGFVEGVLTSD